MYFKFRIFFKTPSITQLCLGLFFLFFYPSFSHAQPAVEWSTELGGTLNDLPHALRITADNGFIIAGQSGSSDLDASNNKGGFDLWLTKVNAIGELVWEKNYGGSADDYALDIQLTADGGYIMTGGTASDDGDLNQNFGGIDVWVIKTDAAGNLQWSQTFGGSGVDLGTGIEVLTDGYILAGCTSSAGQPGVSAGYGGNEFWVLKLDLSGNLLWEKTYGGKRHDAAKNIIATDDGCFLVAGNTWSKDGDITNNHGHNDAWIIKIDATGNLLWEKTYGGNTPDHINSFAKTLDGNYVLAGSKSEMDLVGNGFYGRYDEQYWIFKISPTGNLLWEKIYGGNEYDEALSILPTSDDGYIVGGWVTSTNGEFTGNAGNKDAWILKLDAMGNREWSELIGGEENEVIQSVTETNDGGFLMLGYSNSLFVPNLFEEKGFEDWWLVKFRGSTVTVNLGTDRAVCKNEIFTLDANVPNCNCTYLWDDGNTDASRILELTETTTFSVTVTDDAGAEGMGQITVFITEPEVAVEVQDIVCFGYQGGAVELTPQNFNYTYTWNTGATTQNLSNLNAGTYTYTVTDENGCTISAEATVEEPLPISISENLTEVDCYGNDNGAIDLSISGGASNYEYTWASGETTQDIYNLTAGGYTVTILDANDCISVQGFVINQPPTIDVGVSLVPANCFNSEDGGALINPNGGVFNFSYEWSNGSTQQNLQNVPVGTYTLTVTDGNFCEAIQTIEVGAPTEIQVEETVQDASCFGNNDGSISINATGGNGNLYFNWDDGQTTPNISQLSSGTYTVTVSDDNVCEKIQEIVVSQNTDIEITSQITAPSCFGANDGNIDITPSGGLGNLTFLWNRGDETEDIGNLENGDYIVTIVDDNGCEAVELFTLEEPEPLAIAPQFIAVSCAGGGDGSIQVTMDGGDGNYSYEWSNGNTTDHLEMLTAGTYTLSVLDGNGCELTEVFVIEEPDSLQIIVENFVPISCFGNSDAEVEIIAEGGTPPYIIQTTTGGNSDLPAGEFGITVTDNLGCALSTSFVILQPDELEVTLTATNPTNGDDGKIIAQGVGGTAPYDYSWNGGTLTGAEISDLPAGIYDLILTDANGCTFEETVALVATATQNLVNLQHFEIYPNPNEGTFFLKINFEKTEPSEILITNELGQMVQQYSRDAASIFEELTLANLSAGIYFVLVKTQSGVAVKRLLIQK